MTEMRTKYCFRNIYLTLTPTLDMEKQKLKEDDWDKFDEANRLRRRFSELEENKREKLQNQENSTDDTESNCMAICGWVEKMEEEGSDSVELKVSYFLDGEEQVEHFDLNIPSSEEEFSLDNRFVRMVNFFGDRRNDPTGLLNRKIWLKVRGNNVSLHIPDSLSRTHIMKQKLKRKRISKGIGDWEGSVIDSCKDGVFSAVSASIGIFGFVSLASATNVLFAVGTGFVSAAICILLAIILLTLFQIFDAHRKELLVTLWTVSVLACFSGSLGIVQYTIPPQNGQFTTTLENSVPAIGSIILLTIAFIKARKPIKKGIFWSQDRADSVRTWYQRRKGIEYIDRENR